MSKITCESYRRFGVEIELNTTTNIIREKELVPDGSDVIAGLIREVCPDYINMQGWQHINNNPGWVIKPDSTCGIEVNTPIMKGGYDILKLCKVVEKFKDHPLVQADSRCSFHVHINYSDVSKSQVGHILAWWIKCEGVFFDSVRASRKCHRHTQLIGMNEIFDHSKMLSSEQIIDRLGDVKYHSANCYHMKKDRRQSIEYRIASHEFCTDPYGVKNWIRLLLHFSERALQTQIPNKGPLANLCWLGPKDVFDFLGFNDEELSDGMQQVRRWFLGQLLKYMEDESIGVWGKGARATPLREVKEMIEKYGPIDTGEDLQTLLYDEQYYI